GWSPADRPALLHQFRLAQARPAVMMARLRLLLLLALLLWPLAGLAGWAAPAGQRPGFIDPDAGPLGQVRVAVLPFSAPSGPPEVQVLGEGMLESLLAGLQYVPSLVLVDRSRVERALKGHQGPGLLDAATATALGRVLDVQFIISGTVEATGNSLR